MDIPVGEWHYSLDGKAEGPVTWAHLVAMARAGRLTPAHAVWREGMPDWAPAGTIEELFPIRPGLAGPVMVEYSSQLDPRTRIILRNARHNCITMFVLLVLPLVLLASGVAMSLARPSQGGEMVASLASCTSIFSLVGALYAMLYLPLRWRAIMSLPRGIKVLGLIGGFGLIVLLVVTIVLIPLVVALLP